MSEIYECLYNKLECLSCLMFACKTGAYPSETLEQAPILTRKHKTWMEKLAMTILAYYDPTPL